MPAAAGAPYLAIGSTKRPARAISVQAMSRRCRVVNCSDSTMLSRSSPCARALRCKSAGNASASTASERGSAAMMSIAV